MTAFLLACAGIVMTKVSGFVGIYSPMRWSCSLLLSCSLLPFLFPLSSGGGSRYTLHVCTVYSTSFTCVHVHVHVNIHSVYNVYELYTSVGESQCEYTSLLMEWSAAKGRNNNHTNLWIYWCVCVCVLGNVLCVCVRYVYIPSYIVCVQWVVGVPTVRW